MDAPLKKRTIAAVAAAIVTFAVWSFCSFLRVARVTTARRAPPRRTTLAHAASR